MVTIITPYGLPNDGVSPPRETPQPEMPIQVSTIIYFVSSQALRTIQALTTTPKFMRPPGHRNRKKIDYKTKAGEALYKKATRS